MYILTMHSSICNTNNINAIMELVVVNFTFTDCSLIAMKIIKPAHMLVETILKKVLFNIVIRFFYR